MNWFGGSTQKRSQQQRSKSHRAKKQTPQQTFILEPLITPSGLVDSVDHTPHPLDVDLHTTELPDVHLPETDLTHLPDTTHPVTEVVEVHSPTEIGSESHSLTNVPQTLESHSVETHPDVLAHSDHPVETEHALNESSTEHQQDSQTPESHAVETHTDVPSTGNHSVVANHTVSDHPVETEHPLNGSSTEHQQDSQTPESHAVETHTDVPSTGNHSVVADHTVSDHPVESEHPLNGSSTEHQQDSKTPESHAVETHTDVSSTGDHSVLANHTVEVPIADHDLDPLPFLHATSASVGHLDGTSVAGTTPAQLDSTFTSGVFTVGAKGEVSFDYLFDGGAYEGQVAIFNLNGMEHFVPGSEEFMHEAASRALSNSNLGHIVMSDATEGARFSGSLPWEGDFNSGAYQGVTTFSMNPGDKFGIMLVPNGTVQQVLAGDTCGDVRPLFSMTMANPNEAFHVGQIADVNGHGNTFVMEDLRTDGYSDRDYNDIIFQIHGATGKAINLDNVIDQSHDWRTTELGGKLMEYIKPPANQPLIGFIDTGLSAQNPDIDPFHVHFGPHSDYVAHDGNPLLQPNEGSEHGTHVTGIVAATSGNGIGIDGINDQAPIYVERATGSGQWAQALTDFVDAAKESGQPHAIANLSLDLTQINPDGSVTTRYEFTPTERAALEYAHQNGVLIVASAGNDGGVMSALGQASQEFDNIITVGAAKHLDVPTSITPGDVPQNFDIPVAHSVGHTPEPISPVNLIPETDHTTAQSFDRADYSSYGYGLDIVADGGTIDNPVLSTVGDNVGTMAGTSVATAQVTGAASQVWAGNPDLNYRQVIEILKSTATDLKTPGWDMETGAGLLNIAAAVTLAKETTPEPYTPDTFGAIPTTWSGEGIVTPTERAALTAAQVGQQPTGGTYASGYVSPWKGSATLTEDWNSSYSHNGSSAYAKDWVIADSKVYAAKAGTVVAVKQDSTRYGDSRAYINDANYVIIRHDDGYESMYVHLKAGSVPVRVGQRVEAGTYIGQTGLSGWTTGEHLHFEVRKPSTKQSVPFKLDGSTNTPNPQTPAPISSGVWPTNFTAWVMATVGANVRSGPGTAYQAVGAYPYQTTLEFDAWTYGETITDVQLGTPDARWYRIKGTNNWVSSAVVYGNAPGSSPLPSNNVGWRYAITAENFSGWVGPSIGVNLRNSPAEYDRGPLNEPYGKTLSFDAWTYGDTLTDIWLNTPDALWYRVAGTNYWVPSAYINGYPGSHPPVLPPNSSDTSAGYTVSGNFNSVWQQYRNTLGYPTSGVVNHSSGASYQLFENGSIVSSQYGTFPLYGGIRQTYLNTGGLDGWLGAPKSAEISQGNGVIIQYFANGYIIWNGSKATAYRTGNGTPVTSPPVNGPVPGQAKVNNVSEEGLKFIARHEGMRLTLYNDPAGNATIGVGHLVHSGPINGSEPAEFRSGITESRALELLKEDVSTAVRAVNNLVKVPLNQNQFDALVSFTFNLGAGNLQKSDLLAKLNAGQYDAVPAELNRWVYGGGQVLPGLVTRRRDEGILFRNGQY